MYIKLKNSGHFWCTLLLCCGAEAGTGLYWLESETNLCYGAVFRIRIHLNPDPDPETRLNPDPIRIQIRIRIRNTVTESPVFCAALAPKICDPGAGS